MVTKGFFMEMIAKSVGEKLLSKGWFLATAESCTGGLVSKLVTDVAGSSQWFDRGFITYTNDAKIQMLGVSESTLNQYGAVSEQTVREMAEGVVVRSAAQCSIAISGIAGPSGGSLEKPVGTICFAWKWPDQETQSCAKHFEGDRESIRQQAAIYCLEQLADYI